MSPTGTPRGVLSPCGNIVRAHDPDRYLSALFADPSRREGLFALYAFNHEVAKIPDMVSEPMQGHIRLQWWRENIDGIVAGTPREHEVVSALAAAIREFGLERDRFDALIDAREADVEGASPATLPDLIERVRGTAGALSRLALEILEVEDPRTIEAAQSAAIGWALTGILRSTPYLARAKRLMLPEDLLASHGVAIGDYHELRDSPQLRETVRLVALVARDHLAAARAAIPGDKKTAAPVLLLGAIAARYQKRLERTGWNPFDPAINAEMPSKVLTVWLASLLGRY